MYVYIYIYIDTHIDDIHRHTHTDACIHTVGRQREREIERQSTTGLHSSSVIELPKLLFVFWLYQKAQYWILHPCNYMTGRVYKYVFSVMNVWVCLAGWTTSADVQYVCVADAALMFCVLYCFCEILTVYKPLQTLERRLFFSPTGPKKWAHACPCSIRSWTSELRFGEL